MPEMDFPPSPYVGQTYTSPAGTLYSWSGYAWIVGAAISPDQSFATLNDIMQQIRTLLQDTDLSSGAYRYDDGSIVQNINMGMLEMYRLRPDIFLETGFVVPAFTSGNMGVPWPIEQQWVPLIVIFAAGMTQLRDDEQTQDARAQAFIGSFKQSLMTAT